MLRTGLVICQCLSSPGLHAVEAISLESISLPDRCVGRPRTPCPALLSLWSSDRCVRRRVLRRRRHHQPWAMLLTQRPPELRLRMQRLLPLGRSQPAVHRRRLEFAATAVIWLRHHLDEWFSPGTLISSEDREGVAQTESNSFQDRPNYMSSRVRRRESNQSPPSCRIEVRRALAHKVRSPEQTVASRRSVGRVGGQRVVRITVKSTMTVCSRSKLIPKPT